MPIVHKRTYLTYDDVLLAPGQSLKSRNDAEYGYYIWGMDVLHPIIPANMDSISGFELCRAALETGGLAVLHRFMSVEDRLDIWTELARNKRLFISIGVTEGEKAATKKMLEAGVLRFCIDIAHGYAEKVYEMILFIKELSDGAAKVMAGNVATPQGYKYLKDAGADMVKVGVGPGSQCTTRIVTGCGVPQFSAIYDIYQEFHDMDGSIYPIIIADGGLKNSGDITKALAAGASFVMSGSFFAGCREAPGEIIRVGDSKWKVYRGMASKDAQIGWQGLDEDDIVAEGESSLVPCKGKLNKVIHQLLGGLSSGMSYVGAETLKELTRKAVFVKVSPNALTENKAHGYSTL